MILVCDITPGVRPVGRDIYSVRKANIFPSFYILDKQRKFNIIMVN